VVAVDPDLAAGEDAQSPEVDNPSPAHQT